MIITLQMEMLKQRKINKLYNNILIIYNIYRTGYENERGEHKTWNN